MKKQSIKYHLLLIIMFFLFSCKEEEEPKLDFYFYSDGKVVLTVFPEKTYIKFEEKIDENKFKELNLDMSQIIHFENDTGFGAINPISKDVEYSYAIVSSDLTSNNIINDYYTMPFFKTENGIEVGISHLFTVMLKTSSDFAVLDSIAKANRVKIVGNHTFRPLWYTISCDMSSKGNALQMANIFYESGLFQYAIPDIMEEIKFSEAFSNPSDPLFSNQ